MDANAVEHGHRRTNRAASRVERHGENVAGKPLAAFVPVLRVDDETVAVSGIARLVRDRCFSFRVQVDRFDPELPRTRAAAGAQRDGNGAAASN